MKAYFITLGCKVNSYESECMKQMFIRRGWEIANEGEDFDACVINTCTVTNEASAKSRKMIRKAIKQCPKAIIGVTGCYAQAFADDVKAIDGVDIVVGNAKKSEIVDLIIKKTNFNEQVIDITDILHHKDFEEMSVNEFERTRAFIKIEDGCNQFCSYCIIPFARGPVRSKKCENVINEVNEICANGYNEIVLTGIHTGKYQDKDVSFTDLVTKIMAETPLKRLRTSSIELNEITDDFIKLMQENKAMANHLHLPLQAGSDHVLHLMNRRYTRDEYISRVNKIKEALPGIAITTDIIVGFPEETDEDFEDTLALCREVGFAKIHAFPFSLRKGTMATKLTPVKDDVKAKRMEKIIALDNELKANYEKNFVDTTQEVIFESKHKDEYMLGHTSNYLAVYAKYDESMINKVLNVKITEYRDGMLFADII